MATVILIIHIMLALGLIAVVLLQRSEGGALGMGGGGGGFMTGRGAGNFLTRVTAGLATAFFATSLILSIMAAQPGSRPSLLDTPIPGGPARPGPQQQQPTPPAPGGGTGLPQINLTPGGGSDSKVPQSK
jgi:preprotein translocase subunit SecG